MATTREVEMYRLWTNGGDCGYWDTAYYRIPADTPEDKIEEVARAVAIIQINEPCAGVGIYNLPDDDDDGEADCTNSFYGTCKHGDDVESTLCGSYCRVCLIEHVKECEICAGEFPELVQG
jgi:hypothetical protein